MIVAPPLPPLWHSLFIWSITGAIIVSYSLNVSPLWVIFPFKKKKKSWCLCPTAQPSFCVEVVFVVAGNSPAAISIKKLISGAVCAVPPHLECLLMYVRTAHKENTFKVRLKLEPFHHEALWEVLCIWGGNKYCQMRAKRSQYTAFACVIFRAWIYCGLVSFCSAV